MDYSRRAFGKLALAGVPAAYLIGETNLMAAAFQAKPNSVINGVTIGTITYSYGSMGDQSAEATLRYVVESGLSQIELMGGPVNSFLGAQRPAAEVAPAVAGLRRVERLLPAHPVAGGVAVAPVVAHQTQRRLRRRGTVWLAHPPGPRAPVVPRLVEEVVGGAAPGEAPTPEQQAAAAQAAEERKKWREASATMDKVRALRKMYNDAGVQMYAVKNLSVNADDAELDFQFTVAKMLGADHITAELPAGANAAATLKRVGDFAMKRGMFAAYHTHAQGSMTAFDEAFAASKGNKANIDFGHYVAGGSGNPVLFLEKFHDRIASFHLKDRTTPANCALNLAWGTGETPIKELLQTVKKNKWRIPATIELEYAIPPGSDAVKEVRKCLEYCKNALA